MYQLFEKYFPNVVQLKQEFLQSTWETLYMVFWTALIAGVLGVLLGVVLVSTGPSGVLKNPPLYSVLEKIINVCRSIPFIIMLALIQPFGRNDNWYNRSVSPISYWRNSVLRAPN